MLVDPVVEEHPVVVAPWLRQVRVVVQVSAPECRKVVLVVRVVLTFQFSFSRFSKIPDGGGPAGMNDGPAPEKDFGRRRGPPARGSKAGPPGRSNNNDDSPRSKRRTSLRIGTGRKGRGAELTQRRGSLKKRDRSAQKEAKLEAALERKTVQLPEYV